jgi:glycosyltransferase involved in cell wall biosynthesis
VGDSPRKVTVAVVGPAGGRTSGIALYTNLLVVHLRRLPGLEVRWIRHPAEVPHCPGYDVVHVQLGASPAHAFALDAARAVAAAGPRRARLVATLHEPVLHVMATAGVHPVVRWAARRALARLDRHAGLNVVVRRLLATCDRVVVLSEHLRSTIAAPHVSLIRHPVVTTAAWTYRSPGRPLRIWAPGLMGPGRDRAVLRICAAAADRGCETEVWVSPERQRPPGAAAGGAASTSLGAQPPDGVSIRRLPYLRPSQFLDLFSAPDLVYIPRLDTCGEVSGPMVYALAAAAPLLVPDVPGSREYVVGGYPATYDVADAASVGRALSLLLGTYERQASIARTRRDALLASHAADLVARQHAELYRSLVG